MNKFLLICIFSVICQAQNIKVGAPAFFPTVWTAGRELLKTISDGLSNTQKIDEEAQKREAAHKVLLAPKKSHLEIILEREKRIKALRWEIFEANQNLKPAGSHSAQELEAELLGLIELGSRLDEDVNSDALMIGDQGAPEPLLIQKSAKASQWQVPGMFMAGNGQSSAAAKGSSAPPPQATSTRPATSASDTSIQTQQRIQALVDRFTEQANKDTSGRDTVLAVAGGVLGGLSSIVPPPFSCVISAAARVVSLAQTAATNTAESQRLAGRVARLNMAMVKLSAQGDSPLAQRAATDLLKVFNDAISLLEKFQPDHPKTFMEHAKATWTQYSGGTLEQFNAIHHELTLIMIDRDFALSLEDKNRMAPPTIDEIREGVRQELVHVESEVKLVGERTGRRLEQLENDLKRLIDTVYPSTG